MSKSSENLTKSSGNLTKPSGHLSSQSMMSVWSPNSECPTFAEVLRRNASEDLLDEAENTDILDLGKEEVAMETVICQEEQYKIIEHPEKQTETELLPSMSRHFLIYFYFKTI